MVSESYISFGNGIVAFIDPAGDKPILELGHYGLQVPEFDVPVTEHGVSDGGTVGTSRANARHMRMTVWHNGEWTRRNIMKAFTPNVERTLTTPLGSMPYYVEALDFPGSLHEADKRFSVSLVSPLAYPLGALLSKSGSTSLTYTTVNYDAAGTATQPEIGQNVIDVGTVFDLPANQTLVSAGLYLKPGTIAESVTISVYEVALNRLVTLLGSETTTLKPSNPSFRYCDVAVNSSSTSNRQLACVVELTPLSEVSLMLQPDAAYSDRSALSRELAVSDVASIVGGSYRMRDTRGSSTPSATAVYITSNTELPCYPKVTVTLASAAAALTISDGTRTATITGSMASGAVVVLDSTARTVTVNGTDRIAWFDRTGDWPLLYPGVSKLTTNTAGSIAVEWQPRMMGLI